MPIGDRKEWRNISPIGTLYIDRILVWFDGPELFLCVDEKNLYVKDPEYFYLVELLEAERVEYVAAKISADTIKKLVDNEIPTEEVFRNPIGNIVYLFRKEIHSGGIVHLYADKINAKDVPSEYLPDKGDLLGIPFE